jgi:hypothetical protein
VEPLAPRWRNDRDAGYSLAEFLVLAAIVTAFCTIAVQLLSQDEGRRHSATVQLRSLLADARALATSASPYDAPSGATLVIVPVANGTSASVYSGRPIATYTTAPIPQTNLPAVTNPVAIQIAGDGRTAGGFSIFVSSSGHASYAPWLPGMPNLAAEPACEVPGFSITLASRASSESHVITCEDAQLEP